MLDATRCCQACGTPLPPRRPQAKARKWCNQACANWSRRHPGEIRTAWACERCQKPLKKSTARFCAPCWDRVRFPRVTRPCEICGEVFEGQKGRKYCSERCKWQRPRKPKSEVARQRDRRRIRPARTCPICGEQYHPTCGDQKYCSRRCGGVACRKEGARRRRWPSSPVRYATCPACGKLFIARLGRKACSKACSYEIAKAQIKARILERYRTDPAFRDQVLSASHARRADKLGLESNAVLLSYLIKRDKGRCGICHRKVRAKRGPMRPSIDHIIPLSRGGTHDLANVQLSHYRCNLEKHNSGGGEQLLLIG